tara:strand:- start:592 stop:798 length:207 start_codon:yes stop_codon:yes gene_type:complete
MVAGPRKNKMKASPKAKTIANLKTISPGVMVNKDYKPGKDAALDSVLDKLKKDPSSLDSSGMGNRWKI